jgi:hypothetical protein
MHEADIPALGPLFEVYGGFSDRMIFSSERRPFENQA